MRRLLILIGLGLLFAVPCLAQTTTCTGPYMTFSWTLSVSDVAPVGGTSPVNGYQIWMATASGAETTTGTPFGTAAGGATSTEAAVPSAPGTYYFTATASYVGPVYSNFSNEVSCTVPAQPPAKPAPPTNFKF
jgi:hypothetical protein